MHPALLAVRRTVSLPVSVTGDGETLAAAGAEGLVSFFALPPLASLYGDGGVDAATAVAEESRAPLASVPVHRRWIADVQWVGLAGTATMADRDARSSGRLLLSASDDGTLVLSQCRVGADAVAVVPLAQLGAELHRGGIYAMDERDGAVATCSKDGSVALSALHPSRGLVVSRTFPEAGTVRVGKLSWSCCGAVRVQC